MLGGFRRSLELSEVDVRPHVLRSLCHHNDVLPGELPHLPLVLGPAPPARSSVLTTVQAQQKRSTAQHN